MSTYPGAVDTFRTVENDNGIEYTPSKTKVIYAEDLQQRSSAITAIESTLGVNPQGAYATVVAWLNALVSAIAGKQDSLGFTAENVANKKTSLADNSDTYYPSQKAVKTAVDAKQNSLGFTAEDVANKATTTSLGTSDIYYPSQNAVKAYADSILSSAQTYATTAARAMWPVGSLFFGAVATNPGTLLGFGTWSAYAEGKVLVGKATSGTFGTGGATGGAETVATNVVVAAQPTFTVDSHTHTGPSHTHSGPSHTHTGPSHTHPLSNNGQAQLIVPSSGAIQALNATTASYTATRQVTGTGSTVSSTITTGIALAGNTDAGGTGATGSSGTGDTGAAGTGATSTASATGTTRTADVGLTNNATSVLQPYIVVYIWQRTV